MKEKAQDMEQRIRVRMLDWLYQESHEDEFFNGKDPKDLNEIWEDEG